MEEKNYHDQGTFIVAYRVQVLPDGKVSLTTHGQALALFYENGGAGSSSVRDLVWCNVAEDVEDYDALQSEELDMLISCALLGYRSS